MKWHWDCCSTTPPTPTPPPASVFSHADFRYNGDGQRVKSVLTTDLGSTTTYFVGAHYEVTDGVVTKYYYAGSQRIAMRSSGTLYFMLGDHLGSTSLVTFANGNVVFEMRYKAWGEVRYSSAYAPTNYSYTGQHSDSYINLLWYGSRHYDPELGRFIQPDSIVPLASQGVQAWDRFGYANNNPVRYTDPTGHVICDEEGNCNDGSSIHPEDYDLGGGGGCSDPQYCENNRPRSQEYWKLYRNIWAEINRKFDPFLGSLPVGFPYMGSQIEIYDLLAADAYWQNGYDLDLIGCSDQENPMTYKDFENSDLSNSELSGAEWVLKFGRPKSYVAEYFLLELDDDFDTQNILNYEPNYLDALMSNHSGQLADAKNSYFNALMNMYGPDLEVVWDYMRITISARGPGQ